MNRLKNRDVHVLDASGILHSDIDYSKGAYIVTNSVLAEVLRDNARTAVDQGIRNGAVKVSDPRPDSVKKARAAAGETGDLLSLSAADLDVLALALERKGVIVSDDYAIQNVARRLGLQFSVAAQDGIKKEIVWEKKCPGCGRTQPQERRVCNVCGSKLKRVGRQTR